MSFDHNPEDDDWDPGACELALATQERDHLRQSLDAIRDYLGLPADLDHLGLVSIVERHRRELTLAIRGEMVEARHLRDLGAHLLLDLVQAIRGEMVEARHLRAVAVALGHPDQPFADLPDSVKALRLQRDHLQAAAQDALALGRRP